MRYPKQPSLAEGGCLNPTGIIAQGGTTGPFKGTPLFTGTNMLRPLWTKHQNAKQLAATLLLGNEKRATVIRRFLKARVFQTMGEKRV